MTRLDMNSLARRGAEVRIEELNAEVIALLSMFPDLRSGTAGQRRGPKRTAITQAQTDTGSATPIRRRQRKPMTAAQRKAVGVRMKKYWAARRATKI